MPRFFGGKLAELATVGPQEVREAASDSEDDNPRGVLLDAEFHNAAFSFRVEAGLFKDGVERVKFILRCAYLSGWVCQPWLCSLGHRRSLPAGYVAPERSSGACLPPLLDRAASSRLPESASVLLLSIGVVGDQGPPTGAAVSLEPGQVVARPETASVRVRGQSGRVRHELGYLRRVLALLGSGGVRCWVFGGWAEELRALCPARAHNDVDLLYVAEDFTVAERLIGAHQLEEIKAKRFAHKRAFVLDDVMVELFFVEQDETGLFTNFWGRSRHDWPADVLSSASGLPVASVAALTGYRARHGALQRVA